MTNQEAVIGVLKEHACLSGSEVKFFAKRMFNVDIPLGCVAVVGRNLFNKGLLCKQIHPVSGKVIYWLTEEAKNEIL